MLAISSALRWLDSGRNRSGADYSKVRDEGVSALQSARQTENPVLAEVPARENVTLQAVQPRARADRSILAPQVTTFRMSRDAPAAADRSSRVRTPARIPAGITRARPKRATRQLSEREYANPATKAQYGRPARWRLRNAPAIVRKPLIQ